MNEGDESFLSEDEIEALLAIGDEEPHNLSNRELFERVLAYLPISLARLFLERIRPAFPEAESLRPMQISFEALAHCSARRLQWLLRHASSETIAAALTDCDTNLRERVLASVSSRKREDILQLSNEDSEADLILEARRQLLRPLETLMADSLRKPAPEPPDALNSAD